MMPSFMSGMRPRRAAAVDGLTPAAYCALEGLWNATVGRAAEWLGAVLRKGSRVRSLGLDILRIFAAVWVVLVHWTVAYPTDLLPQWFRDFSRGGYLGVDLFFFLSGAVIIHTAMGRTWWEFGRSRFLRLFPAFFAVSLLVIVQLQFTGFPLDAGQLAALTGLSFWTGGGFLIQPAWTLALEVGFYVLVGILILVSKNDLTPSKVRMAAYLFLIVSLLGEVTQSEILKQITLDLFGPMFVLGALLSLCVDRAALQANMPGIALAAAMSFWSLIERTSEMGVSGLLQVAWVIPMLVVPSAVILWATLRPATSTRFPWMRRQVAVLALMTYPLYLLHYDIGLGIIAWLKQLGLETAVAIVASAAVIMTLSWVSVQIYEPRARRWLSRLLGWKSAGRAPREVPPPAVSGGTPA
jgi:peptidoglycan/LPS O-acetylase OafA/YrhL